MKIRIGIILTIFLLFASCAKQQESVAVSVILSKNQMITIMTDVQLVEAALLRKRELGQNITDLKPVWYDQLFKHHRINNRIFEENLAYYNQNLDEMEKILDEVLTNLSKIQSGFETTKRDDSQKI